MDQYICTSHCYQYSDSCLTNAAPWPPPIPTPRISILPRESIQEEDCRWVLCACLRRAGKPWSPREAYRRHVTMCSRQPIVPWTSSKLQHVDPTPSVTTNASLLRPAIKLYFDKTEFQQMGVLELPVANCYLLKNKIHPMFGRQNFGNTWHHVWPHVQQILRLASRFVDDEAVLPFWHALLFEKRPMLGLPPIESYVPEHVSVGGPLNLQQMERTKICLQHYRGLGTLKVGFYTDPMGRSLTRHTYPGANSFINLDDRYREVLDRHITGRKPMTETQPLRFQFAIAKTLVHEVAHAVYRSFSLSPIEPYVNTQFVSELGRAWELWTFGCLPTPALSLRDCSHGLVCIAPWPDNFETTRTLNPAEPVRPMLGLMNVGRVSYAVETEWIQKVQMEAFWDIEVKHRGVGCFEDPSQGGNQEG